MYYVMNHMKKLILLVAVLAMMVSCGNHKANVTDNTTQDTLATDTVIPDERGYIVEPGDMAPDFTATIAGTSEQVTLSDYRNKRVVMLQFTASWCGVCRREMPEIESQIWQRHKDNPHFALLGIDRDEPDSTVVAFAQKTGVTYPLALDPNGDIFCRYAHRMAGITRNVIVDTDGRIVMLTRLYDEEEFARMTTVIDSLLVDVESRIR